MTGYVRLGWGVGSDTLPSQNSILAYLGRVELVRFVRSASVEQGLLKLDMGERLHQSIVLEPDKTGLKRYI